MATEAQVQANRRNAQKSTGPRTVAGKAVVAQNAVKHGLTGQEVVIQVEDPGEFEFYRERMLAELDPVGEVEADLADRIVGLSWRLKRGERLQAVAFDSLFARQKHSLCEPYDRKQDVDGASVLGRALVRDFGNARVLDRLLMYERRIEHSLYRTMAELKRHRILSEVGPGKMWELRRALAHEDEVGRVSSVKCQVKRAKPTRPELSRCVKQTQLPQTTWSDKLRQQRRLPRMRLAARPGKQSQLPGGGRSGQTGLTRAGIRGYRMSPRRPRATGPE